MTTKPKRGVEIYGNPCNPYFEGSPQFTLEIAHFVPNL
jgi:hypothetical protein